MAEPEHVAKLKAGINAWNQWRVDNPEISPDLSDMDLRGFKDVPLFFPWYHTSHPLDVKHAYWYLKLPYQESRTGQTDKFRIKFAHTVWANASIDKPQLSPIIRGYLCTPLWHGFCIHTDLAWYSPVSTYHLARTERVLSQGCRVRLKASLMTIKPPG